MPVTLDPRNGSDRIAISGLSIPSDYSVYAWIRRAPPGTNGGQPWGMGASFDIDHYWNGSNENFTMNRKSSGTTGAWEVQVADRRITWSASQWVFWGITQSGVSTPKVYSYSPAQGVSFGECTVTVSTAGTGTATTTGSQTLYIGNYAGADYCIGGDMAWFGFHNVVLTAGEMQEAAERGYVNRGRVVVSDLRDTTNLFDLSGNANTLTNTGGASLTTTDAPVLPGWLDTAVTWVPAAASTPAPSSDPRRRMLLGVGI